MVEREQDAMRLRCIAGALSTGNANAASLHRDQVRGVVDYLEVVTQAARAVMMRALIDAMNGAEPEAPAVDQTLSNLTWFEHEGPRSSVPALALRVGWQR